MFDRQKAFNTAYHGLAAQGFERSIGPLPNNRGGVVRCVYRGEDGKRCALGYMIPDWIYDPAFEGGGPCRLPDTFWNYIGAERSAHPGGISSDEQFLIDLQLAHDCYETPEGMKYALACFADKYDLTIPTLPVTADTPASEDAKVERITITA